LFNAVNWVESSAWDGRDAIVVAGDIALYKKGAARPTGGVGVVAMLIGPDAEIILEPGKRGSYMQHAYDFYKPDLTSEYPYVDGHYSVSCYTEAVDACYKAYNAREKVLEAKLNGNGTEAKKEGIDRFDYLAFHSPTCKLVEKSYARLLYNDYLANPEAEQFSGVPEEYKTLSYADSLKDRALEKYFMGVAKERFTKRVKPSTLAATQCGNMYTASLYSGLISLIANIAPADLVGKRIGLFSYGSGLASTFFSAKVVGDTTKIQATLDLHGKLAARRVVEPQVYDDLCILREKAHLQKEFEPKGDASTIAKGAYYLTKIDDMFRRTYVRQE
jgi:hydroxymethylglutaryl-CoA synthase